jgi:hypothetical protein
MIVVHFVHLVIILAVRVFLQALVVVYRVTNKNIECLAQTVVLAYLDTIIVDLTNYVSNAMFLVMFVVIQEKKIAFSVIFVIIIIVEIVKHAIVIV